MKKIAFALAAVLLLTLCLTGCGGKEALTLNVYNWGEYISDGSEGSFLIPLTTSPWWSYSDQIQSMLLDFVHRSLEGKQVSIETEFETLKPLEEQH